MSDCSSDVCSSDLIGARRGVGAFGKAVLLEPGTELLDHLHAAAHHDPVSLRVELRRAGNALEQLAILNQRIDANIVTESLAREGRQIMALLGLLLGELGRASGGERVGPHGW